MQDFNLRATEEQRQNLQCSLDTERTSEVRNRWGQFATPSALADDIIRYILSLHGNDPVSFIEPSCGSGSFISALYRNIESSQQVDSVTGVELDSRFVQAACSLWGPHGAKIIEGDFLADNSVLEGSASLLVANPPYSRHHHLSVEKKSQLKKQVQDQLGITASALSGLYLYFVLLSHRVLAPGAVSAWLIPSEFFDVNFGKALKEYLTDRVSLVRIHRFAPEDEQFADAMITSSVVVFVNRKPSPEDEIELTFGGSVTSPESIIRVKVCDLPADSKWTPAFSGREIIRDLEAPRFDEFFKIRRGIATGSNKFFVLPRETIAELGIRAENVVPMMPSSRYLKEDTVDTDEAGFPSTTQQLGLIATNLTEEAVKQADPGLAKYLAGADEKVRDGYLVRNRNPWYKQEHREPAHFLLTYMGRSRNPESRPFRFILNKSKAIATNGYLMLYPSGPLKNALDQGLTTLEDIHEVLKSITGDELRDGGRVYGGGMHKVEPKELAAMDASAISALIPGYTAPSKPISLF